MLKYDSYRDGGTKSFKNSWFSGYFKVKDAEVCLDHRMNTETYGRWYLKHSDGIRNLTQEEKDYVVPIIIEGIERDVNWRMYYLETVKKNEK